MDTGEPGYIKMIKASEFKAKYLGLVYEVANTGKDIVIARNGRPVVQIVPCRSRLKSLFGIDRDNLRILGDVVEPLEPEW